MPMNRKIIKALWDSYRTAVIPANATHGQRRQLRLAFYAGASATLLTIMQGLSDGPDPTQDDEALVESLFAEIGEFKNDVEAGKI